MKYDTIIIGAGLGGLTAGAKLAKEGRKVLLIEQHSIPGGFATTFKRKDFTIEVSLHEMDGLGNKLDPKTKIFQDLDIFENVEFIKVPEFYRFIHKKVDIVIPHDYQKASNVLLKRFPHEEKGIKKFFTVIQKIRKEILRMPEEKWKFFALLLIFPIIYPYIIFYRNWTIGKFLDSIIKDEDLKLVLIANLAYYHDNPFTLSLLFFAAAQGSYFSGGGYFIKGGSQKLSDYLAGVIKNNGGKVLLRRLVTKIIIQDKKAIGVKYKKMFGKTTETKEAFGNYIISNAAIPNVVHELLPASKIKNELMSEVKKLEISCSLLSLYLGFKKTPKELGNKSYSTFVCDEGVSSLSDLIKNKRVDFSKRGFVFVDYSQIDSQLAPKNKGVGVICTIDYLSDWEGLTKKEYLATKRKVAESLIERLNELIPGIAEQIEYFEVGTPKTMKRYTLNPEGTAYGFAQTPGQVGMKRIQQKSLIQNLYFASAWTTPGAGFSGAILSGYWCAKKILKK